MALNQIILDAIKKEINLDPNKIGYAGKTEVEIQNLLNNPVPRTTSILSEEQAPINRILSGIAAPNIVDVKDVTDAQAAVVVNP